MPLLISTILCPACSCSYPFIDISNTDQREEVTRSVRMVWQQIQLNDGTIANFESPHKVPPTSRIIQIKTLVKIGKRLKQPKSFITFNAGKEWASFAEMFQFDPNWNGTMTRGGWTIHNIHLLDQLIQMAVQEYIGLIYSNEPNYFNKRRYT